MSVEFDGNKRNEKWNATSIYIDGLPYSWHWIWKNFVNQAKNKMLSAVLHQYILVCQHQGRKASYSVSPTRATTKKKKKKQKSKENSTHPDSMHGMISLPNLYECFPICEQPLSSPLRDNQSALNRHAWTRTFISMLNGFIREPRSGSSCMYLTCCSPSFRGSNQVLQTIPLSLVARC